MDSDWQEKILFLSHVMCESGVNPQSVAVILCTNSYRCDSVLVSIYGEWQGSDRVTSINSGMLQWVKNTKRLNVIWTKTKLWSKTTENQAPTAILKNTTKNFIFSRFQKTLDFADNLNSDSERRDNTGRSR